MIREHEKREMVVQLDGVVLAVSLSERRRVHRSARSHRRRREPDPDAGRARRGARGDPRRGGRALPGGAVTAPGGRRPCSRAAARRSKRSLTIASQSSVSTGCPLLRSYGTHHAVHLAAGGQGAVPGGAADQQGLPEPGAKKPARMRDHGQVGLFPPESFRMTKQRRIRRWSWRSSSLRCVGSASTSTPTDHRGGNAIGDRRRTGTRKRDIYGNPHC